MINWIVTSSVLILIIIFLRTVLRGKISLRLQYALWAIVLIRLLFPFEFGATDLSLLNAVENVPVVQEIESLQGVDSIEHMHSGAVEGYYGLLSDEMTVVAENKTPEEFSRMKTALSLRNILMPIWRIGAAVILLVFLFSNCRFAGELKKSRTKRETELTKLPVYITDKVDTPCLFGLFKPAIYVTEEAAEQEDVFRHAVKHETTHFYHKDHVWAVLRCLAIAIHWYNPLVWWAAKLSREDAELACDEATLIRLGDSERASYGRTLLSVTCEKRAALFSTATTMTGSGKSIKERIALIAKKPKMAVYTFVAVVIIAAVAMICTFTGAKDKPASFEEWTSSVTEENIQWAEMAKEYGMEEISYTISGTEFRELAQLLGTITDGDCSRKNSISANEEGYRLALYRDDKLWLFKCLDDGNLILQFNDIETASHYGCDGKCLIIESPELWEYIKGSVDSRGMADTMMPIDTSSVPKHIAKEAVQYAKEYVYRRIDEANGIGMYSGYTIVGARISNLEQISTGTAAEMGGSGVNLYRLEYRLLPDYPEAVEEVGGMKMDGDEITEWNSAGQPYLLIHYGYRMGEKVWEPICWINTEIIDVEYSTPEMIDEYGDAYTAAAMELWKEWSWQQENETPAKAVDVEKAFSELMAAGEPVSLMFSLEEDHFGPFTADDEQHTEELIMRLHEYQWKEMKEHQTSSSWSVTVSSADDSHRMVFYEDDTVEYFDGNKSTYWRAECQDYPQYSAAISIRGIYYQLERNSMQMKFQFEGSAEAAAEEFIYNIYGSHLMSLSPGNESGISKYEVIDWDVMEVADDGKAVVAGFAYAFDPWYPESSGIWAGNTMEGTGEYEGMLTAGRQVVLEKQDDGYWHCIGMGTGGYRLPDRYY